jgi:hypothetical protein
MLDAHLLPLVFGEVIEVALDGLRELVVVLDALGSASC